MIDMMMMSGDVLGQDGRLSCDGVSIIFIFRKKQLCSRCHKSISHHISDTCKKKPNKTKFEKMNENKQEDSELIFCN